MKTKAKKSAAAHTPTPWGIEHVHQEGYPYKVERLEIWTRSPSVSFTVAMLNGRYSETMKANAAFITHACNVYEDLLAALYLCVLRDPSLKNNVMVTEAIAKAEGK